MRLRIQSRKQYIADELREHFYYETEELEIESFRWGINHEFEYVIKGNPFWRKLEPNEEIVGLSI